MRRKGEGKRFANNMNPASNPKGIEHSSPGLAQARSLRLYPLLGNPLRLLHRLGQTSGAREETQDVNMIFDASDLHRRAIQLLHHRTPCTHGVISKSPRPTTNNGGEIDVQIKIHPASRNGERTRVVGRYLMRGRDCSPKRGITPPSRSSRGFWAGRFHSRGCGRCGRRAVAARRRPEWWQQADDSAGLRWCDPCAWPRRHRPR